MEGGATGMVPLTPFAEWFGARVDSSADGALHITLQKRSVTFTAGKLAAGYGTTVAGSPVKLVTLPAAPVEHDGFVYVPLTVFIDGLGILTDWSDRWLQAKLHHPTTGEVLTVALADPDAPDAATRRAMTEDGPYTVSEVSNTVDGPLALFVLEQGTLRGSEHPRLRPHVPYVKCYGLTRYLGVGNFIFSGAGNKATFSR